MTPKLAAAGIVIALAGFSVGRAGYSLDQLRHVVVPTQSARIDALEKQLRELRKELTRMSIQRRTPLLPLPPAPPRGTDV